MRPVQKVSVSLLIAIIGFSAFSFFAFSGLFDVIEASFYSPRVLAHYRTDLENAQRELAEFRDHSLERFSAIVEQEEIRTLYQPNQTRGDIEARAGIFRRIEDDRSGFVAAIFLNRDGTQIHFSTREDDYTESDGIRTYQPLEAIEDGERWSDLALTEPDELDMVLDSETSSFVFRLPVMDENGIWRGTGLFIFSPRSYANRLIRAGITDSDRAIELVSTDGIVLNVPREGREELREAIADTWEEAAGEALIRLSGDRELVIPVVERSDLRIGYVVPSNELTLSNELQAIVLAGTFLTLFLIVFLLLNIRQDTTVVLSERIKRFQLGLLREYLERGEELDWGSRRDELLRRKPEMTRRLKQGIGRVRAEDREKIDHLVDKSWDEIVDVLGSRRDSGRSDLDLQQIERMLERVIGNLESRGVGLQPAGPSGPDSPNLGRTGELDAAADVQEVEELEELEETDEAKAAMDAQEAEELEEVEDPDAATEVQEVEELEELDEADEAIAAANAQEAEDLDEARDAQEVEELDELEELDAAGAQDAEAVEVADAVDDTDDEAFGELEELEEAEPVAEEELEEVEPIEYAEATDELSLDESDELRNADIREEVAAILDVSEQTRAATPARSMMLEERSSADHLHAGQATDRTVGPSAAGHPETVNRGREATPAASDSAVFANGQTESIEKAREAAGGRSIVPDAGGVYRIREDVYSKQAVGAGISGESPSGGDPATGNGDTRSEDAVLLLGDVDMRPLTRRKSLNRGASSGRPDDARTDFSEDEESDSDPIFAVEGIDLDRYLSHFRDDEPGIMRGLMLLTRKVYARVAMIAVRGDDGYHTEYGIGLNEHEHESVQIPERSEFAQSILKEGRLFRFEGSVTELPGVEVTGQNTSIGSCRCVVFIPVKFRGTRAYLVLGVRDGGCDVLDIATTLAETIRSRSSHR